MSGEEYIGACVAGVLGCCGEGVARVVCAIFAGGWDNCGRQEFILPCGCNKSDGLMGEGYGGGFRDGRERSGRRQRICGDSIYSLVYNAVLGAEGISAHLMVAVWGT